MTKSNRSPIEIRGIRVQAEALLRLKHRCDPALCKGGRCCCRFYEVTFTRKEVARVVGLMPHCTRYAPELAPGRAFDNPFDKAEGNLFVIDERQDGTCAFAYTNRKGHTLCSIHSAALDLGLDPYKTKAAACVIWPLALSEDKPPILSVQDDIYRFPCNTKRRAGAKRLDAGVAEAIASLFGPAFLHELQDAIARSRPSLRNRPCRPVSPPTPSTLLLLPLPSPFILPSAAPSKTAPAPSPPATANPPSSALHRPARTPALRTKESPCRRRHTPQVPPD